MTSIDSGVETSNDSNDSYVVQDAHSPLAVTPIKSVSNSSVAVMNNSSPSSSTTNSGEDVKEKVEESKALVLPTGPSLSIEPPAGILFCNIRPSAQLLGTGYELLESGIAQQQYAVAVYRRKMRNMRCCLKIRKDPWQEFRVPLDERKLRYAALTNDVDRLTQLLEKGVNPNCCDAHKRTPLHLASCKGYCDIVRILLEKGANPNQRDSLGNTPLHLAACTNHVGVVTLLLKAGTDVRSSDYYGRNPLQLAQSKLKLLQRGHTDADSSRIKAEVQQVIEMMLAYLQKQGHDMEAELLNAFSSRLTLSQTKEEVETDVRDLLESLNNLSLSKSETDK
ncbi:ankyrin repeat domain-containing protein 54 [Anabrus simplex]|uniref:ankyrin repeat domain-containing protein 54 n=1 Tax=Anabrus simplex TaxID=316456 RepID=UPI0034DCDC7D